MKLVEVKCASGCSFLKEETDPMICKCAAVQLGKRAKPSDAEAKADDLLNLPGDVLEAGVLRVAIANLNKRAA